MEKGYQQIGTVRQLMDMNSMKQIDTSYRFHFTTVGNSPSNAISGNGLSICSVLLCKTQWVHENPNGFCKGRKGCDVPLCRTPQL